MIKQSYTAPLKTKVVITLVLAILAGLSFSQILDDRGLTHTEAGLSRALVTFGVSRGLNGIISVVQGTEIAVEPVGVGVTFAPGQILDPVNDLVENFSSVVLLAGTAFGAQRVILEVTSSQIFQHGFLLILVSYLLCLWFGARWPSLLKQVLLRVCMLAIVVRFAIPMVAISGEWFYQTFLEAQYTESSLELQNKADELSVLHQESVADTQAQKDDSFFAGAKRLVQTAGNALDIQSHLEKFKAAAESISENAIRLMVVFMFQTLIVPLASLWLILQLLKACLRIE